MVSVLIKRLVEVPGLVKRKDMPWQGKARMFRKERSSVEVDGLGT
jgi:hypothetical protein